MAFYKSNDSVLESNSSIEILFFFSINFKFISVLLLTVYHASSDLIFETSLLIILY